MTPSEMRTLVWEALGKPTDLDPSSDVSYTDSASVAGPKLTQYLNMAQRKVATWKDPIRKTHHRIPSLINDMYYRSTTISETVTDDFDNATFPYYIEVDAGNLESNSDDDDRYNGWVLEDANNERQIIMDFDADGGAGGNAKITYADTFGTDVVENDTVTLYKNFDLLLPSTHKFVGDHISLPSNTDESLADGNFLTVLKIEDVSSGYVLEHAPRALSDLGSKLSTGDPRTWRQFGNKIVYDVSIDEDKWFRMEYYRSPLDLTHAATVTELSEIYHTAIIYAAITWGLKSNLEDTSKYSAQRDFENEMRSIVSAESISGIRTDSGGSVIYRKRSS